MNGVLSRSRSSGVTVLPRFLLVAVFLGAAPASAWQALSARSFYMDEPVAAVLLYDLAADLAEADLHVDVSAGGRTLTRDASVRRGRHVWVHFPTADLPVGDTEVVVQLRGSGRDLGTATATVTRRASKANAAQIDRLGGGLIVDGLPFFPFGFYCYSPVQPTLAEEEVMRGFNMISPYQSNEPATIDERRQYMDRAAELGLKVHYQLLQAAGGGGVSLGIAQDTSAVRRRAWLQAEVETFRDHPALLAWYISDEPTGHGATPEELRKTADLVRELDPYHPVTILFVNPGAAARFAGTMDLAMDLAMTNPYPIPNTAPGSVADAVRTVHDALAPKIPLWHVPQAFGGNEWWPREPTASELRLMTWLGIIEGATGVQYFIRHGLNGFPKSQDTWAAAGRAALEVAALTPYLLSPEARPLVDTGDETLRATAWRHGDDVIVAVVNTLNLPREMELTLPGFAWDRDEAEVLYEDRVIPLERLSRPGALRLLLKPVSLVTDLLRPGGDDVAGVRFADIIDAYGVRLYRFAYPAQARANELNTLIDPSFEWDAAPSVPAALYADIGSGRGATYFVDSRDAAHGRRSLRLHSPRDGEGVRVRPYAPAVIPGRSYRFSLRARSAQPGVVLRLLNAAADDSMDIELTPGWQQYWLDGAIKAVSTRAWLSLGLATAGTAWIDDMELFDISPRIMTAATPEGHTVRLVSVIDDAELRLRLDGEQVTSGDPLYTGPVTVSGGGEIHVGLFHGEHLVSRAGLNLYYHDALSRFVDVEHAWSPRYTAGGAGALTDGILGTKLFTDGRWQGYEGQDLVADVDLGRPVDVATVSVRFLQSISSRIWLPRIMEVNVSDDGRHFRPFATADHGVDEHEPGLVIEELTVRGAPERARYVRVRARSLGQCPLWHPGAGGPAWVFVDEIRVNAD